MHQSDSKDIPFRYGVMTSCAESLLQLQVCTVGFFGLKKKLLIELEDLPIKKRWKMLLLQNSLENMEQYTTLRKNYLINSTRKYDDLGDWLYFKLIFKNLGTLLKAVLGDRSGLDKLLDNMFYDYNDNH